MGNPGENSIFKRVGKRILDPYAGKEIVVLRYNHDEIKIQSSVRVIPMSPTTVRTETSPLDDLVEGFRKDLHVQDMVEIVRVGTTARDKTTAKPPPAAATKPKPRRKQRQEAVPERDDNNNEAWSQERFWTWVAGLGWGDRSDRPNIKTAESMVRHMSPKKREAMLVVYNRLYEALAETLDTFMKGYDMGEKNRRALLSHIIARGETFYNAICADPDFASYLISDASLPPEQNEFIDFASML